MKKRMIAMAGILTLFCASSVYAYWTDKLTFQTHIPVTYAVDIYVDGELSGEGYTLPDGTVLQNGAVLPDGEVIDDINTTETTEIIKISDENIIKEETSLGQTKESEILESSQEQTIEKSTSKESSAISETSITSEVNAIPEKNTTLETSEAKVQETISTEKNEESVKATIESSSIEVDAGQ